MNPARIQNSSLHNRKKIRPSYRLPLKRQQKNKKSRPGREFFCLEMDENFSFLVASLVLTVWLQIAYRINKTAAR